MSTDAHLLLGAFAWIGTIVLPPLIARRFWKAASFQRSGWIVHLLFVPCVIAGTWILAQLVSFAAHDDGEGSMALGFLLMPSVAMLALTIVGYFLCLAFRAVHSAVLMHMGRR